MQFISQTFRVLKIHLISTVLYFFQLDNVYKEKVRLMTDDETKFFGSGQLHSFDWWKQFCRILSDNGFFVRQNLYNHNKEANRSHVSVNGKDPNRRRITLSQKGSTWYDSDSIVSSLVVLN